MDSEAPGRGRPRPATSRPRPKTATPRQRALVRLIGARLARARAAFRVSELGILLLAAAVGAVAGLAVAGMGHATQLLHRLLFDLPPGIALSASSGLDPWRVVAVPVLAGLLLAAVIRLRRRLSARQVVDPIEANALHGGRMSLLDSFGVGLETMISNGGGASVGLEAGYSQVGAGMASAAARMLGLRRNDVRLLVGCGAAGAIGAAFGAPLTGAFYAFELVIGGYTVPALAPVIASALAGSTLADALGGHESLVGLAGAGMQGWRDQAILLAIAPLAALAGIGLMLGVTTTERLLSGLAAPRWLRPALGGACVGGLGLLYPQVLSSGHGALFRLLEMPLPLAEIALVLLCKSVASAVSIGAGFRGGLFFASVFMGALFGGLYAGTVGLLLPGLGPDPQTSALIGMSSMAVAVVGGPLTMVFLALETTHDFALAPSLIAAVMIATVTARRLFGYSFATWRFHLRGEAIRSAHDIGWIRNLTVGRLMRRDVRTARADTLLGAFRRQFPLGSTGRVVVVDAADRYAGIVLLPEAHAHELDDRAGETRLDSLLRHHDELLLPSQNVKEAAALFERAEADALAVVDGLESRRVLGLLTEQHALRRYAEELDQRRRELSGEH
ncbi:MAG: chloride channel protein [Geminicoccaceae bacterium]